MNQLISTDWLDRNLDKVKILDASWHLPNVERNAFEEYYDVSVISVNTLIHGGGKSKMKHTSKGIVHQKKKILKKAIITLAEGDVIDLYENI